MALPLPDNVKEILNSLTAPQQVVMRSYIATLRAEIKDLNEQLLNATTEDPHAHYHGHEKCTADHGHAEHGHHGEEEGSHDHEHKHEHHGDTEHKHEHHEHGHCDHESHKHEHHEHCAEHDEHHGHHHEHHDGEKDQDMHHHSHEDEHHGHGHEHGHGHHDDSKDDAAEKEMPAWKKKALEADPNAAPFGGTWTAESNISASDKMEE